MTEHASTNAASSPGNSPGAKQNGSANVGRKSPMAVFALIAVVAVVVGVGGAWLFLGQSHGGDSTSASEGTSSAPVVVHLEGFTVNLADREDNHFLRVTMDLALDHVPQGASREKPATGVPMARIRDTILAVLTVCNADTLLTPDGKIQLKKNLLTALNRDVPDVGVRDIYFTEFLVQR